MAAVFALLLARSVSLAAADGDFALTQSSDQVAITHAGQPVATYIFRDEKILRPYFSQLHAPGGVQITRTHPPVPAKDATDHNTMHPGLWLAFGDVSGHDFWRNRAIIKHERFSQPPVVRDGRLTFATENLFQTTNGQPVCAQHSRFTLARRPAGYLLIWEATFSAAPGDFLFGDQEEMGLGVRVATAITEKNGGVILTSTGAKGAKATWGKAFDWCDYSGVIGDRRVGVSLMPDPANFRQSWFHNRDYGLMVANPFGRKAMAQGDLSRVAVKSGERLRLRFGVLLHTATAGQDVDLPSAYRDFLSRAGN